MSPDPARLAALFDTAAELPEAERAAFVARSCGADAALAAALLRLLDHDRARDPEFMRAPVSSWSEEHVSEDLSDGTRIGRLVILRKLGEGGMGSVYAAYDETLDRKVAVKRLHHARGDREAIVREARVLAQLSHPNVVQVHEIVETAAEVLLVLEFVQGVTLRAWAAQSRGWREVLGVFVQAGRGLAAAHAVGLVHRDFKPDNVMLGDDARVRVLDFGLAAPGREGPRLVAGTPAFMAPEQLLGEPLDPRCDQFSFCLALYTCLFGQAPFVRDDLAGVLAGVDDPPRPPPPTAGVAPRLAAAVLRGLARAPAARWPDMDALLAALEEERTRDPEVDVEVGQRQRRALLVGLVCLALAVDAYIFLRPGAAGGELTPADLVRLMNAVVVVVLALIAALWRSLRRSRINRQIVGVLLVAVAVVWVHRALGLRQGTPTAHTLIGDLLLLSGACLTAAITFRREFVTLSAAFVLATLAAAHAPERAAAIFSFATSGSFLVTLLWWWRRG